MSALSADQIQDDKKTANFLAKWFISRTDVFAEQQADGSYRPVRRSIKMQDILDHLSGSKTYGHYMLDQFNRTKMFVLDLDFNPDGWIPGLQMSTCVDDLTTQAWMDSFAVRELRTAWMDRRDPARDYLKMCMRTVASRLQKCIHETLGLNSYAAYSGSKGIHIYVPLALPKPGTASLERVPASMAREAAHLVLENSGLFVQKNSGDTFWAGDTQVSPEAGLFSAEIFPKQSQLDTESRSSLGSLVRLPLGKNLKNKRDAGFFIDDTRPMSELASQDPSTVIRAFEVNASS